MLKRYKNVFFEMIEAAGLSLGDFTAKGGIEKHTKDPAFIIRYHPANLTFTAINPSDNPHLFYGSYTIYAPTVLKRRGKEVEIVEGPPSDFSEAASRLLWKIGKAYSLGIPKNKLAHGVSQTEEEHAYARRYTICW